MKRLSLLLLSSVVILAGSCSTRPKVKAWNDSDKELAHAILSDRTLDVVDSMGHKLLLRGYNAGDGYNQTWIRDFNTFIETILEVAEPADVKKALTTFFRMQQENGEIIDGYIPRAEFNWDDPDTFEFPNAPDMVGFKNTVETDQETSLIQAVRKYVEKTGDMAFLEEEVAGKTVLRRLSDAVEYLMNEKLDPGHKLLTGALTADWGDVEDDPVNCVDIGPESTITIDVYDNAMMVIALRDMTYLDPAGKNKWDSMRQMFADNIRRDLWDSKNHKFIPHLYPQGNKSAMDFDESRIYYHGGTAIAIEADILSKEEIRQVNEDMLRNVKESGMPSIGLTVYPTYPPGFFPGWMASPFNYQNGGDWTWFGGRMIQQLVRNGFVAEAYQEIRPMIDRVIVNGDFYEWYAPGCVPSGSSSFKGSAGVLCKAIEMLKDWAKEIDN